MLVKRKHYQPSLPFSAFLLLSFFGSFRLEASSSAVVAKPRLGDRIFVSNVLIDLFGAGARPLVIEEIRSAPHIFGGQCDVYEEGKSCRPGKMNSNVDSLPESNLVRQGIVLKVCAALVKNQGSLDFFVKKAGLWATDSNDIKIKKIYRMFNPGKNLGSDISSHLLPLLRAETGETFNLPAAVKLFCGDPGWQVL